jgi:uncharacterized protein
MAPGDIVILSNDLISRGNRPYKRSFLGMLARKSRCTMITGKRGVGKTTCMIQVCAERNAGKRGFPSAIYVPADHIAMRSTTLYETAEWFSGMGGKLLAFDEIHTYQDWTAELKSIYDSFPDLEVMASGSAALRLQRSSHDLSRRLAVRTLPILSFREYIGLRYGIVMEPIALPSLLKDHAEASRSIVATMKKAGKKVLPLFAEYLEVGCYPYFQEYGDTADFHRAVERTMIAAVEVDLIAAYPSMAGASVRKMLKLIAFISTSVPFTPDMRKLKSLLDIGDERTLKQYLKLLEDAGILRLLSAPNKKLAGLEKPEKIYLGDCVQLHAVSGSGVNPGTVRETFFLQSLSPEHEISCPAAGDFLVDGRFCFEVGGKGKGFDQIADRPDSFLALDGIETGFGEKMPLWILGFCY